MASVASSDPYLLHSRQALELGAAEVLLLEGGRLQHEMLLLRRVHLLQVLSCGAGRAMQGLLNHLSRAESGESPGCGRALQPACCRLTRPATTPGHAHLSPPAQRRTPGQ